MVEVVITPRVTPGPAEPAKPPRPIDRRPKSTQPAAKQDAVATPPPAGPAKPCNPLDHAHGCPKT
jgi:hypothetical protein